MGKRGATLFLVLLLIFSGLIEFGYFFAAQDEGAPKIFKHSKQGIGVMMESRLKLLSGRYRQLA